MFDGTVTKPCCMRLQTWGNNGHTVIFSLQLSNFGPASMFDSILFYRKLLTKFGFARPCMLLLSHYIPYIVGILLVNVGYIHIVSRYIPVFGEHHRLSGSLIRTSLFSLTGMVGIGVTIPKSPNFSDFRFVKYMNILYICSFCRR